MSTCEHKGPGPCHICEHVEQASIPSSPEVAAQRSGIIVFFCRGGHATEERCDITERVDKLIAAQHAASTAPLLAEIEKLREALKEEIALRNVAIMGQTAWFAMPQGERDTLVALRLAEYNTREIRAKEMEAEMRSVDRTQRLGAAEAEAQKLREAMTKYGSHLVFCPGFANNDAECTCGLRKALGGSK